MSDDRWTWTPDGSGGTPPPLTGGALPPAIGGPLPPVAGGPVPPVTSGPVPPVPGGTVLTPLTELPVWGYYEPPRRRRTGLWVGVGLGVVALVGAGVAGWVLVGQKMIPARSPQAAVERLVDGLTDKDGLAVLGAMSRAEIDPLRQAFAAADDEATADPEVTAALQAMYDSVAFTVEGLELETTELDTGLAKVALVGGTVRVDGDPEQIVDAWLAAAQARGGNVAEDALGMRAQLAAMLDQALPFEHDLTRDAGDDAPFLVTVRESHGWYVSPLMTLGEYAFSAEGLPRGAMPSADDVAHPADPQAAAEQLAAAIPALVDGDAGPLVAALPEAERRFVAVYIQPALDEAAGSGDTASVELTASDFAVIDSTADRAAVVATNLAYAIDAEGQRSTASFDGDCVTIAVEDASGESRSCLSDVPLLAELGLSRVPLVTVRESGGWYVSVIGTFTELSRIVGENLERLQAEGKLDDPEWLQQQLPSLVGLLGGSYDAAPSDGWDAPAGSGEPMRYGDDPFLDELWDLCESGDAQACDWLSGDSPPGSDYEWFGASCGGITDPAIPESCAELAYATG